MIYRNFNRLKFKRTYIGGSKQSELQAFEDIQGIKEDNSECDWLEYRRILTHYLDDTLNIVLSWKYLLGILRLIFIVISIFVFNINTYLSILILVLATISHLIFLYLKKYEKGLLSQYDFSLDIVLNEINNLTGFKLFKN